MKSNLKYVSILLPSILLLAGCNFSQLSEKPSLSADTTNQAPAAMEKPEEDKEPEGVMEKMEKDNSEPIQVTEDLSSKPSSNIVAQVDEADSEVVPIPEPEEPGSESIQVIDSESLRALNPNPGDDCNQYQGLLRHGCHRALGTSENPRPSVEDSLEEDN